jgi:hypothetical protein
MLRNHARKLFLALALCAVVGGPVPDSQAAAASISSAGTAVEHARWDLEVVKPKPKPPYIVPQTPVPFNSDLKVTHALTTPFPNGSALYTFKIENIGLNTSGQIKVQEELTWAPCNTPTGTCFNQPPGYTLPPLASGAETIAHIFCNSEDQPVVCTGARLRVSTPNDPGQSNNAAAVGLI